MSKNISQVTRRVSPVFIEHEMLCHNDLSLKMGCFLQGSHCKLTPTVGYKSVETWSYCGSSRGECLEVIRVGIRCLRWRPWWLCRGWRGQSTFVMLCVSMGLCQQEVHYQDQSFVLGYKLCATLHLFRTYPVSSIEFLAIKHRLK